MEATFRVYEANGYEFPSKGTLVKSFTETVVSEYDLGGVYEECRSVWSEYMVEAEVEGYVQGSSSTYSEEVRRSRLEEAEWEYMNGEYPDDF